MKYRVKVDHLSKEIIDDIVQYDCEIIGCWVVYYLWGVEGIIGYVVIMGVCKFLFYHLNKKQEALKIELERIKKEKKEDYDMWNAKL